MRKRDTSIFNFIRLDRFKNVHYLVKFASFSSTTMSEMSLTEHV